MHSCIRRLVAAFSVILLAIALISCSGGGGSDTTGVSATYKGTVTLLVTDAPTSDFEEINLTVAKVELISDDGKEELFNGEKVIDLLQLTDVTEVFSISTVPSGFYSKIRLTLTEIELVFTDESKAPVYPKLPGNGKLDLNPRGDFYVDYLNPLTVQLDYDAKKSIHIVETGNGKTTYNFRPVVFTKIVEHTLDTKLIRQKGTIESLDGEAKAFDLCLIEDEVQPLSGFENDDFSGCIQVDTTNASASIFDEHADPIYFEDLNDGDIATVVGRFSFGSYTTILDSDNAFDDSDRPQLVLSAEVIWAGNEITQTTNVACSGVTMDVENTTLYTNYALPLPDGGESCVTPAATNTILQPGVKIYNSDGKELDDSYIDEGILNQVDAYADTENNSSVSLKAVLVMLGQDTTVNQLVQLDGTIGIVDIDFDNNQSYLSLLTDLGDQCVNLDGLETRVFEITRDDEGNIIFSQMSIFSLKSDQQASVFGNENVDCLDADTIIYEAAETDS